MKYFSHTSGFTLVELMIVMAIIGILAAALFPSFTNYIERGRDTARLADVDTLSKSLTVYFSEKEQYPASDAQGCIDDASLGPILEGWKTIHDPQPTHSNGCNTLGRYAYAMSTGIISNPNVYSIMAKMEQPLAGNYGGSTVWFTGTLTTLAYNSGITATVKGAWAYYIRVP